MIKIGCWLGFLVLRGKTATRSGVRTHEDICPLDLKSNALTSRPSWYTRSIFCIHTTREQIYVIDHLQQGFSTRCRWRAGCLRRHCSVSGTLSYVDQFTLAFFYFYKYTWARRHICV